METIAASRYYGDNSEVGDDAEFDSAERAICGYRNSKQNRMKITT